MQQLDLPRNNLDYTLMHLQLQLHAPCLPYVAQSPVYRVA